MTDERGRGNHVATYYKGPGTEVDSEPLKSAPPGLEPDLTDNPKPKARRGLARHSVTIPLVCATFGRPTQIRLVPCRPIQFHGVAATTWQQIDPPDCSGYCQWHPAPRRSSPRL